MKIKDLELIDQTSLKNKVIAFPTDTVFGLGALIDDELALNKIYQIKKRNLDKPLAILAGNVEDIFPYIEKPSNEVIEIMNKYWPGALTIIFKKSTKTSNLITKNLDTIAFRIPNSFIALKLLNKVGPLATTSINISGDVALNDYHEIDKQFGDEIDYLLTINSNSSNVSSTIIDCTSNQIKVIRQGEIKIE